MCTIVRPAGAKEKWWQNTTYWLSILVNSRLMLDRFWNSVLSKKQNKKTLGKILSWSSRIRLYCSYHYAQEGATAQVIGWGNVSYRTKRYKAVFLTAQTLGALRQHLETNAVEKPWKFWTIFIKNGVVFSQPVNCSYLLGLWVFNAVSDDFREFKDDCLRVFVKFILRFLASFTREAH